MILREINKNIFSGKVGTGVFYDSLKNNKFINFRHYLFVALLMILYDSGVSACENFKFSYSKGVLYPVDNYCEYVKYNRSNIISLWVKVPIMELVSPRKLDNNLVIVRIRYVSIPRPRGEVSGRETKILSPDSILSIGDNYKFYTVDGGSAYLHVGFSTYEVSRLIDDHVEVIYQFIKKPISELYSFDQSVTHFVKSKFVN